MGQEFENSGLWSKRFLPHYDASFKFQMITYRLADSLPQKIITQANFLGALQPSVDKTKLTPPSLGAPQPPAEKYNLKAPQPPADKPSHSLPPSTQKRIFIEESLDKGYGSCLLSIPSVAENVLENWLFYDKQYYDLIAYVIMPNHVHILIKTYENRSLSKIVWSWKSLITKFVSNNPNLLAIFEASMKNFESLIPITSNMKRYVKESKKTKNFSI